MTKRMTFVGYENAEYGEWKYLNSIMIRYREVTYDCPVDGRTTDFQFQIFKKPFFFGFLRKSRWEDTIKTNSFDLGIDFSYNYLGDKHNQAFNVE